MDKTITVVVETKRNHPVYGNVSLFQKYKAHDENNVAKEGDIVRTAPAHLRRKRLSCRRLWKKQSHLQTKGDN